MDRIRLKDKEFELFIPEEEIKDAIAKVAERIREDVKGTNPLFVGILNGAFMFTAELMRQLNEPYEITFARYSSYKGTSTTGVVREIMPVQADVKGRTLIMIEDIIDTGFTMQYVKMCIRDRSCIGLRTDSSLVRSNTPELPLVTGTSALTNALPIIGPPPIILPVFSGIPPAASISVLIGVPIRTRKFRCV